MRNLKKFLALVLAMMMTLSLMVTVNAAPAYPDVDKAEDAFVEAIEVLSGVGVIKGDEKGNFNPTNNITRAEAAAIMYRIVTGDVKDDHAGLHTGAVNFTDVKDSDWFAGYVGYCADQGIIKGRPDGSFAPTANVTGYEMLAMLLRALGYGQKGEFTGSGWEIPVGSRATALGILNNVKTTVYGGNLRTAARRDVVADLAFQSITGTPTVTVSSLGDYNQYTSLVSSVLNPTLGEKVFGLTKMTGIIVGNQQTGEKHTLLGVSVKWDTDKGNYVVTSDGSYVYQEDNSKTDKTATFATIKFGADTSLDLFGHKVNVWFRNSTTKTTAKIDETAGHTLPSEYGTVYAVVDKATKTDVVKAGDTGTADLSDTTTATKLGKVAKDAGFKVDTTNGAVYSSAFDKLGGTTGNGDRVQTATARDGVTKPIYSLISNSSDNTLDVVIAMNVSLDQVSAKNDYAANKTVTTTTDGTTIYRSVPTAKNQSLLIYGEEDITVGARVVLNKIFGTGTEGITTAGTQYYYGINKITVKKQGTVTAISGTGKVTLSTGDTIDQSVLWDAATPNPHCGVANLKIGASLTFFLDTYGKYVRVTKDLDTMLVGAYGYYTLEGIDGFKYYIQGVKDDGTIDTVEVTETTYKNVIADKAVADREIHFMGVADPTAADGTGSNVGVVNPADSKLGYELYSVNGNKVLSKLAWADQILNSADGTTVVNKVWDKNTKGIFCQANGAAPTGSGDTPNYFTDETKFYVISGWGSTLKVDTYTGLEALLNGAASIAVEGWYLTDVDDTEHVGSKNNVVTDVYLVNVKRIQPTTFLYNEKVAADISALSPAMTDDAGAVQLQLRVAGDKDSSGVLVASVGGTATVDSGAVNSSCGLAANTFYSYTLDANGYYVLTAEKTDGTGYGYKSGKLTNANTAFGDIKDASGKTLHASDAKVVDITGVDHGITDYMSLRRAVEENAGIEVDVLLAGPLSASGVGTAIVIYVTAVALS